MERHYTMIKELREIEFSKKLRKVNKTRMRGYEDISMNERDLVFYQYEDKKAWLGPERVFSVKGRDVFVFANGNIRKIPRCNVQLSEKSEGIEKNGMDDSEAKVQFEERKMDESEEKQTMDEERPGAGHLPLRSLSSHCDEAKIFPENLCRR